MRRASRSADYTEFADVKMIRDGLDIFGRIGNTAVLLAIRAWIAGPVIADQADSEPMQEDSARAGAAECARRPVQQKHRMLPRWSTRDLDRQPVPAGALNHMRHGNTLLYSHCQPNVSRPNDIRASGSVPQLNVAAK